MSKVSVIIAVFNAEQWIEKCVHSLFSQTLDEIEFIFVDDCSNDKSISIIKHVLCSSYSGRIKQVHFISHTSNLGVAAARTTGMKAATGEYMIHCDPDDWVEPNMYEMMYNIAKEQDADIVTCNYFTEGFNGIQKSHANYFSTSPKECLKHMYEASFFPALWNAMIKTSIIQINSIYPFPNINTGEDLNVIFRVFHNSNKLHHLPNHFYHYNRHEGSLSLDKDYRGLFERNIYPNINNLTEWSYTVNGDYDKTINYLKFQKKMYLLQGKSANLRKWYSTWPECHKDISKFSSLPKKTRTIYSICSKSYIFLWFYFKVIRKFI